MVSRKHFDCSKVVCCERPASIALGPSGFSRLGPPRLYADDNGGDGNTLDARDANHMTVLRSTHSRVAGSNTPRGDNTRIRNGDSRS